MPPKKNAVAARIKRLMQADDDVGKIAQATPVLMGTSFSIYPQPRLQLRLGSCRRLCLEFKQRGGSLRCPHSPKGGFNLFCSFGQFFIRGKG
jgi:hypothetical protein